jgi:hypothetical protein
MRVGNGRGIKIRDKHNGGEGMWEGGRNEIKV